ncbi:MAG: helix-turn-helix domain-containing protein [Isosphaeraceae bacterium]
MPRPLNGYLTVKDAAAYLGVSSETLRNWDRTEKLKAQRHPLNGYRLYRREDLEVVLLRAAGPRAVAEAPDRRGDGGDEGVRI